MQLYPSAIYVCFISILLTIVYTSIFLVLTLAFLSRVAIFAYCGRRNTVNQYQQQQHQQRQQQHPRSTTFSSSSPTTTSSDISSTALPVHSHPAVSFFFFSHQPSSSSALSENDSYTILLYEQRKRALDLYFPEQVCRARQEPMPDVTPISDDVQKTAYASCGPVPFHTHKEVKTCAICLEDIPTCAKVRTLTCSHTYHSSCIQSWVIRKPSCPLCNLVLSELDLSLSAQKHCYFSSIFSYNHNNNTRSAL